MTATGRELGRLQTVVLGAAFVPMLATGGAGGYGTYTNIKAAFGSGTAVGAVAAGEGATAVLAIVLLGLTLLGQSSPKVIRAGLWALPAAASAMSVTAAKSPGEMVIYALTPMGMTASAEGAAFLARRIVVYRDGRDAEAEAHAAAIVQALAYHRARAANHPDENVRKRSERTSWKLARKVGAGDIALADRLLGVQRERLATGADVALGDMFAISVTRTTNAVTPERDAVTATVTPALPPAPEHSPGEEGVTPRRDAKDTQVNDLIPELTGDGVTPPVTPVTLDQVAAIAGVPTPLIGEPLTDEQIVVVLRFLRYSVDPPLSYRQTAAAFRDSGFTGGEARIRGAWATLMAQEESPR
ncbi:hypothetical protein [Streptomyces filamentosus]|uniref:hypothetical protein n=1 Tax=Streptomyces filamentosus TaxID=67294 RepID=UPI001239319C|nr:hypothetical protein [Streptomyces filamentosus]KAA6217431.1 hypothetical protein CP979_11105 [Streptomyces filamentosus]